jgi:hypothetical protein
LERQTAAVTLSFPETISVNVNKYCPKDFFTEAMFLKIELFGDEKYG